MYLLDLVKILSLAALLTSMSKSESRSSLVALAWTLRNREKFRRETLKSTNSGFSYLFYHESISHTGRPVIVRSWNILAFLKFGRDENYFRSLAIASLVWSGEEVDPTVGSTRFHRHDDWPDWADKSEPVALIGNWFFYKEGERRL
jgi:hypothetical protein